jgi:hypothetical protein
VRAGSTLPIVRQRTGRRSIRRFGEFDDDIADVRCIDDRRHVDAERRLRGPTPSTASPALEAQDFNPQCSRLPIQPGDSLLTVWGSVDADLQCRLITPAAAVPRVVIRFRRQRPANE